MRVYQHDNMLKAAGVAVLWELQGFFRKLNIHLKDYLFSFLFIPVELVSRKWKWLGIFGERIEQQSKSSVGSMLIWEQVPGLWLFICR